MGGLLAGTQGWSYPSWVGPFYPEGTPKQGYLEVYAQHFSFVEIDSTAYGIPRKSTVTGWRTRTPQDFVFAAKFPQDLSHGPGRGRQRDVSRALENRDLAERFVTTMSELGEKLGPLVLQLPYAFQPDRLGDLEEFLSTLPEGFCYVVEVRNRAWFRRPDLVKLLKDSKVGLVLVDHPWMPRMDAATAATVYVRLLGDRQAVADGEFGSVLLDRSADLAFWAGRIQGHIERGRSVVLAANNHYAGHSPDTVRRVLGLVGASEPDSPGGQGPAASS